MDPVRSSYVEILCLKREVKNWFFRAWFTKHTTKIPSACYHLFENAFKDFASMRQYLSPYPAAGKANSQWKLDLKKVSPALVDLVDLRV